MTPTKQEMNIASTIVRWFHISTMYRKSSIDSALMYYETIVFEYKDMENWNMLEQESNYNEEFAMMKHIEFVLKYIK